MLYKEKNDIYIKANNKFYKVEVTNGNIVPIKKDKTNYEVKYELTNAYEISKEDIIDNAQKENRRNTSQLDKID